MKLTTKGRYAITAMLDVAINGPTKSVALHDISNRQSISLSYLEQLFSKLRNAKLVKSQRGPGGGYLLAKDSNKISLFDVITAVDENIDQTQCGGKMNCNDSKPCLTHNVWIDLNKQINDYMKSITLENVISRDDVKQIIQMNTNNNLNYVKTNENNFDTPIYLDYSATTPVDTRVAEKMSECLTIEGIFGNPASRSHPFGWDSEKLVEEARKNVAAIIKADSREIIWTSGATESDNLAIKGAAHFYKEKGNHLITLSTEHKAVLDTMRHLESEGFEVTYLDPNDNGILDLNILKKAIKPSTILISIMHVNNEIGVVQDIESIGKICRDKKIIFHVDAAQSPGKVEIDVEKFNIDLMSLSAHKVYGPKGIGALYVRRKPRIRLQPQIHGGGHERGFRSGTLPTHQIVGMGEAFKYANLEMKTDNVRIKQLRDQLWNGLKDIEEIYLNGDLEQRIPGNLNISFNYIEGESLMMATKDLAVSSGSACTSASLEPSYVLRALGRDDELAHSSIRLTIGKYTTEEQIKHAIQVLRDSVNKLRALSPLWEMYKDGIDLKSVKWTSH